MEMAPTMEKAKKEKAKISVELFVVKYILFVNIIIKTFNGQVRVFRPAG